MPSMGMFISTKAIFAILSIILGIGAFFPYLRDVFVRKTKPHVYTWLIWVITQGTAVAGIWYGNGGLGSLVLTIGTFFVFIIFLASLKLGTKNITRADTFLLVGALVAVLIWWQLHNPYLAVGAVTFIDGLGYIPTFRKSLTDPWDETVLSWFGLGFANVFAMAALTDYNFLTVAYMVMQLVANISLALLCVVRRRTIAKPFK
jgi:hypothetical protein